MKTTTCLLGAAALLLACGGCTGGGWFGKNKTDTDEFSDVDPAGTVKGSAAASGSAAALPTGPLISPKISASQARSAAKASKDDDSSESGGFFKRYSQAHSQEMSGDLDDARETYEKLIVDFPTQFEPYHRLGLVADRQRRYNEAESLFIEALRIKPRDPELFNDLGYCYYLQGKLEKAESALAKAVAIKPAETRYRNNLGLVYGAQGRMDEALATFRRAGSEADAQYNMAFVLATHNDLEGAKKRFRLALASDPNHEAARAALRSFEQADRDGDKGLNDDYTDDGRRWEPFVENPKDMSQKAGPGNTAATRALQAKAHSLAQTRTSTDQQQQR